MERKLKFKDIAGNIPFGLFIYQEKSHDMIKVHTVLNNENMDDLSFGTSRYHYIHSSDGYKPILYPLDTIHKTITHNGKEIVPIVELANIAYPTMQFTIIEDFTCIELGLRREFGWKNNGFVFNQCFFVDNQYQLFDYLHELKIDYRGLIDAGLAIDVNTLNENPYK